MKKLGKGLILITLLLFLFANMSFSKEIKTFDENYICGEQDSDWEEFKKYEESDKPYRILRHDIENNGIYYDYYNCDESDYEEDDEDDDYEDSDYYDDDEDENYNHISNKNNNNISSGNKEVTVDPNVFYGKKKDECPTEEVLYKMAFYMQPFDASHVNDINSGSQYHYDDTKTAYFYPIITEENYISFVAMAQDGVSELNQTIFIIDFCQFNKDEQGNWSLLSKTNLKKREESYKNVPEKDIFDEAFAKAKSDVNMLIKMMNCKTKATQYVSDTYGYKFYTYASMDNVSKFYLTKSENKKVNEQNQKSNIICNTQVRIRLMLD